MSLTTTISRVVDVEDGAVDQPLGVDVVAGRQLGVHPMDPLRRRRAGPGGRGPRRSRPGSRGPPPRPGRRRGDASAASRRRPSTSARRSRSRSRRRARGRGAGARGCRWTRSSRPMVRARARRGSTVRRGPSRASNPGRRQRVVRRGPRRRAARPGRSRPSDGPVVAALLEDHEPPAQRRDPAAAFVVARGRQREVADRVVAVRVEARARRRRLDPASSAIALEPAVEGREVRRRRRCRPAAAG